MDVFEAVAEVCRGVHFVLEKLGPRGFSTLCQKWWLGSRKQTHDPGHFVPDELFTKCQSVPWPAKMNAMWGKGKDSRLQAGWRSHLALGNNSSTSLPAQPTSGSLLPPYFYRLSRGPTS